MALFDVFWLVFQCYLVGDIDDYYFGFCVNFGIGLVVCCVNYYANRQSNRSKNRSKIIVDLDGYFGVIFGDYI